MCVAPKQYVLLLWALGPAYRWYAVINGVSTLRLLVTGGGEEQRVNELVFIMIVFGSMQVCKYACKICMFTDFRGWLPSLKAPWRLCNVWNVKPKGSQSKFQVWPINVMFSTSGQKPPQSMNVYHQRWKKRKKGKTAVSSITTLNLCVHQTKMLFTSQQHFPFKLTERGKNFNI